MSITGSGFGANPAQIDVRFGPKQSAGAISYWVWVDRSGSQWSTPRRNGRYLKNNQGNFAALREFFTKLTRNSNCTCTLRYRGGTTKTFDTDGKLLEDPGPHCNFMSFLYNAQRQLIRVNDTLGRDIVYRYLSGGVNDGRLQEIEYRPTQKSRSPA